MRNILKCSYDISKNTIIFEDYWRPTAPQGKNFGIITIDQQIIFMDWYHVKGKFGSGAYYFITPIDTFSGEPSYHKNILFKNDYIISGNGSFINDDKNDMDLFGINYG